MKNTKKAFEEFLNKEFPVAKHKHKNWRYGNTKRDYGTYLRKQDPGMFEENYQRWIEDECKYNFDSGIKKEVRNEKRA